MSRNGGGDSVEIGARALAAASGADMTIGVMCTLRDAKATEKAA